MTNTKHIYLLSNAEITDLYALPDFNRHEQVLYFTLNKQELDVLNHYSNTKTRVYFILQLGYFKAKQQFFKFDLKDVSTDIDYILSTFFTVTKIALSGCISRHYINQQKNDILMLLSYQDWSSKSKSQIESHICELLRHYPKGHDALRQLLGYLDNQQIVIPSYATLQDMFTIAFSTEEKRLNSLLFSIPQIQQKQLSALINNKGGINQLNIIRTDQKDFKYTAVRAEVKKAQGIADYMNLPKTSFQHLNYQKIPYVIMPKQLGNMRFLD